MPRPFIIIALALAGCTAIQDQVNPTFLTPVAAPSQPTPAPAASRAGAFPVFFAHGSAELDAAAHQGLDQAASIARARPTVPILIIGYSGAEPMLARQRTRAVSQELTTKGVEPARIRTMMRSATGIADDTVSRRVDIRVDEERVRTARP